MLKICDIEGISLVKNIYIVTGLESYTLFANQGPEISDILFFEEDWEQWLLLASQKSRYTFFGVKGQAIESSFLDCRADSPTFGQRCDVTFDADPRCHLYIEPGIAHRFKGIAGLAIRSEPIFCFDPGSQMQTDRYLLSEEDVLTKTHIPSLHVQTHEVPHSLTQALLKQDQSNAILDSSNSEAVILRIGDRYRRVWLREKQGLQEKLQRKFRSHLSPIKVSEF